MSSQFLFWIRRVAAVLESAVDTYVLSKKTVGILDMRFVRSK